MYWREGIRCGMKEEGREERRGEGETEWRKAAEEISEGCVSMRIMGVCVQERERKREGGGSRRP